MRDRETIERELKEINFKSVDELTKYVDDELIYVEWCTIKEEGEVSHEIAKRLWDKWNPSQQGLLQHMVKEPSCTNDKIKQEFDTLRDFVIQKNTTYGDSLQNPIGVFQKEPLQGILGRIDDKLSRIKAVGVNNETEDTIGDLIGYLIHLKIMIKNK